MKTQNEMDKTLEKIRLLGYDGRIIETLNITKQDRNELQAQLYDYDKEDKNDLVFFYTIRIRRTKKGIYCKYWMLLKEVETFVPNTRL